MRVGVFDIGEIGAAAEQFPVGQGGEAGDHRGAAGQDFGAFACDPLRQVLHAPECADLAQLAGADRDGVEEFLDLEQPLGRGGDGTDAVAGQAVGFGKAVKLDQGVVPIGIGEQIMRAAVLRLSKSR